MTGFHSHPAIWNFGFLHIFCKNEGLLRPVRGVGNRSTQQKTSSNPKSLETFLLALSGISNPGSAGRRIAVSGNALDYMAIWSKPSHSSLYKHGKKYYNPREDLNVFSTLFCFLVYYEFDRPVVNDVENGRPDRYSAKTPTLPKSLATYSHGSSRIWTFVTVERLKKHSEMRALNVLG